MLSIVVAERSLYIYEAFFYISSHDVIHANGGGAVSIYQ